MRRLAHDVPESVSRLVRSTLVKEPPTWYGPVLSNPPPIHPARSSAQRFTRTPTGAEMPKYDDIRPRRVDISAEGRTKTHQMKHLRERKPRVEEIVYEEDVIRRRFFADFPFEALRPTSLVEGRDVRGEEEEGVSGKEWTRLDQRGTYPTVENTIAFTLNLHHAFRKPISEAYETAVSQFADLRGRHELATLAAESEARSYGAEFRSDPFERVHKKEQEALSTLSSAYSNSASSVGRSTKYRKPTIWSASLPTSAQAQGSSEFTAGRRYIERWKLPPPLLPGRDAPGSSQASERSGVQQRRNISQEGQAAYSPDDELDDASFLVQELAVPARSRT